MKTILAAFGLGVLFLANLQAEPVNFRPIPAISNGDATPVPAILFKRGPGYVFLEVAPEWRVTGGATEVDFNLSTLPQTAFKLRPYAGKINFADPKKSLEDMRLLAASSAPATATDVVHSEPGPSIVSVEGKPALEAQFNFTSYGNVLRRSVVIFQDKENAQYSVVTTALEKNFKVIHQQMARILNTWWYVAGKDLNSITIPK